MAIPQLPPPGTDPEAYRLKLGKTKEEMQAMYGDPKPPQQQNFMQAGFSRYYHPQESQGGAPLPPPPQANGSAHLSPARPPRRGGRHLPPPPLEQGQAQSGAPMASRRQVHHDDKQWLKDYHRQHPELSRKEVKNAFIATFGRVPA